MCNFEPDGYAEFSSETFPKSRKLRQCYECECSISPGTRYCRLVQKWGGEVSNTTLCLECEAWSKAFCNALHEVECTPSWELGALWRNIEEFCSEHLGYNSSCC